MKTIKEIIANHSESAERIIALGGDYRRLLYKGEDLEKIIKDYAREAIKADRKKLSELVNKRLEGESQIKAFLLDGSSILNAPEIELL